MEKQNKIYGDKFLNIEFFEDKEQLKITVQNHKKRLNNKIFLIRFKAVLSAIQKFEPKKIYIDFTNLNFLLDTKIQEEISTLPLSFKKDYKTEVDILLSEDEFAQMSVIQLFEILESKVDLKLKYLTRVQKI